MCLNMCVCECVQYSCSVLFNHSCFFSPSDFNQFPLLLEGIDCFVLKPTVMVWTWGEVVVQGERIENERKKKKRKEIK